MNARGFPKKKKGVELFNFFFLLGRTYSQPSATTPTGKDRRRGDGKECAIDLVGSFLLFHFVDVD